MVTKEIGCKNVIWIRPTFTVLRYATPGSLVIVVLRWQTIPNCTASYLTSQQSLHSLKKQQNFEWNHLGQDRAV